MLVFPRQAYLEAGKEIFSVVPGPLLHGERRFHG